MAKKMIVVALLVSVLTAAALAFIAGRRSGVSTTGSPVATVPETAPGRPTAVATTRVTPPTVAAKPVAATAPAAPTSGASAAAAPSETGGATGVKIATDADLEKFAAALSPEQSAAFYQAAHARELEHSAAEYRYKLPSENHVRLIDYYAQQKDLALTADQLAKLDAFTQSLRPQMEAAGIINQIDQFRELSTKAIQAMNAHADNAGELYTQAQALHDQAELAKAPFNSQFLNFVTTILTPAQNQALNNLIGRGVKPSAG